jgi:RNA polymerase sigma-70 factor, ECF subfamily
MSDLASAVGVRAEEQDLVAEMKTGSEQAFALMIAQYSHPIYSLIARSLRDPADAADVTQEVFVKVFRNIASFHGDASLRTWIYRIALHEVSNQRRWWSRHKRQELTIDAPLENGEGESFCLADALATSEASPFDCAVRSELKERVETALRTVPEPFREVVVLREIEGFGYEEIADMLQVNLGTVKSRLTRGRAALREALVLPRVAPKLHKAVAGGIEDGAGCISSLNSTTNSTTASLSSKTASLNLKTTNLNLKSAKTMQVATR